MVKGISRQVIVVHSPEPKLFEQAIFILKKDATEEGVTDEMLLKEAKQAIRENSAARTYFSGAWWALIGAGITGLAWLLTSFL